jgi:two-component system, chemotaxis family, sensor histidine kinase and response regulator PixL
MTPDRTYQIFLLEVPNLLQTIECGLVNLCQDINPTKVRQLIRAAHSIKGGAANLGLTAIESLAHQMETIFGVLSHPELPIDVQLEWLLLRLYDCLHQFFLCQLQGEAISPELENKAEITIATIDDKIGHYIINGQDPTIGAIDLTEAIFAIDVARSLDRLEQVLLDLDPDRQHILAGEFRAHAEVSIGIAQMLNLPGLEQIASSTISALDLHPDRVAVVCCFSLLCFQESMVDVLKGDRQIGGNLTPGLIALATESDLPIHPPTTLDPILDGTRDRQHRFTELGTQKLYQTDNSPIGLLTPEIAIDDRLDFLIEDLSSAAIASISTIEIVNPIEIFDLADIFEADNPPSTLPEELFDFLLDIPIFAGVTHDRRSIYQADTTLTLPPIVLPDHLEIYDLADIFEASPPTPNSFLTPPVQPKLPKRSPKTIVPVVPQRSVRVNAERLERMNNMVGELIVDRHGLVLQNEQLGQEVVELRAKLANFQDIANQLRQIADSLLVDKSPFLAKDLSYDPHSNFDPIELDRYEKIHSIAQEAIEQIAQIDENIDDISLFKTQTERTIERQKQLLKHLGDDLMWARMMPLSDILNRFPRTLHDLSTKFQKPVDLKITGASALVDKAAIEKLLDPLVHLLRNAFDHGIEPPSLRQATGKPDRGLITINAYYQGNQTAIELQDDGRGIDVEQIKAKALAQGLLTSDVLSTTTDEQLFNLLFTPGFSTANKVTELSGRGIGLDIVKEQIQAIKGSITISSELGRGTTFTLRIPLTLTSTKLMIGQVGNAVYAFAADSIQKIIIPQIDRIEEIDSQRFLHWQDEIVPIYNLGDLVTYSIPVPERTIFYSLKDTVINPADWLPPILLIRRSKKLVALQIDRLITEQELTIKSLGAAINAPSYLFGCTILGDGSIVPVLDTHTLIQTTIDRPAVNLLDRPLPPLIPAIVGTSILVVDDSITARQSLCLSLEKLGYNTWQAHDGREALQLLQQKKDDIQLVICDLEMPNMNGFEFLAAHRHDRAIADIPTLILTSRSSEKHRQLARNLGAKGYFVKPYVENNLIIEIERILSLTRNCVGD